MEAQTAGMLADCLTFGNRVGGVLRGTPGRDQWNAHHGTAGDNAIKKKAPGLSRSFALAKNKHPPKRVLVERVNSALEN